MKSHLYLYLILSLFFACKNEGVGIKKIEGKQIKVVPSNHQDSSIIKLIEPYHDKLQGKINRILSYNPTTLTREDGELESSLGNLFADICYQRANSIFHKESGKNIDFALFNYGTVRTVIPKGEVTVNDIFKLMPFESMLVVVELSGAKTQELFQYLEQRNEAHPVAKVKLELKNNKFADIEIQNKKFDPNKNYYVLTHDYLQSGGDNMKFFIHPVSLFNTKVKVRDAIIDYLEKTDTIKAVLDKRFIKID